MAITQLSAFLENTPGTLSRAVSAISDAGGISLLLHGGVELHRGQTVGDVLGVGGLFFDLGEVDHFASVLWTLYVAGILSRVLLEKGRERMLYIPRVVILITPGQTG